MHAIAPYSLRCYDNTKEGRREDRYGRLDDIRGHDLYELLKDYMNNHIVKYHNIEDSKQVCIFSDVEFDDDKRQISGWFNVGSYGMQTEIIDIETGEVDYEKATDKAEIIRHFVHFFVPQGYNEAMAFMHSYRGFGVKSIFFELFSAFFHASTNLNLQMNPLAYDKALHAWLDANAKEVRLTKFVGARDLADQVRKLGHDELELVIKAPRRSNLGKLKDYLDKRGERYQAVEVLGEYAGPIKTTVELDGKQRTFVVGRNESTALCEIQVPEDEVVFVEGVPDFHSMQLWIKTIIGDYARRMYPGVDIGDI
ncbi:hypothetical protein MA615_004493 [Vibrio vulnificus]|uniref:hypothetical protein n=1 Tax=Vibrio vulnificus TaxID=672 RepID=UPI0009B65AB3|nr:hypothetical protein [Vibrio vulnificus]EHH0683908.1 hypothetical protein [Vibrio vulnificus]EHU4865458.1 hypothetical protein [Vibrio vulnificus]EHU4869108.1 hypothetical protein [Vibrio vulnificus]EHU4927331.1 hypothetical protein [Vibrio vulnificus]EHV9034138.1 hypothetical protein [Vibrio vulnificus]